MSIHVTGNMYKKVTDQQTLSSETRQRHLNIALEPFGGLENSRDREIIKPAEKSKTELLWNNFLQVGNNLR